MKTKIIYWSATALLSLAMLLSAYSYFFDDTVKASFIHLGFPGYFRIELGIAKATGALILLLPLSNIRIKDFVYIGFSIAFLSAIVAHTAVSDPVMTVMKAIILLIILAFSWTQLYKLKKITIAQNYAV
jgi:hypothetical protein